MLPRSTSPDRLVLGIDDTDVVGSPGTGRLARMLADELERAGLGRSAGVTRHQLFEGPGVPKTSRNSAAAILLEDADAEQVQKAAAGFLIREHAPGSDPGLAILMGEPGVSIGFGLAAQERLVTQVEAHSVAKTAGIRLLGLGGTRDGVIGALAAAALRAEGNDGRFVGLPGIRDVPERMAVGEILASTGIVAVVDAATGSPVDDTVGIMTGSWVRPRLLGGHPVLVVSEKEGEWANADARPARV